MLRFILIFITFIPICPANAEIYRWVDDKGQVHYSDKPTQNQPLSNKASPSTPQTHTMLAKQTGQNQLNLELENYDLLKVRRIFLAADYFQLNSILEAFQKSVESDITREQQLFTAYHAFDLVYDKNIEQSFALWLSKTPNSYQPYLARAMYYSFQGAEARGGRYADKTKPSQFRAMHDHFAKALNDLKQVQKLYPRSILALSLSINIAVVEGNDDQARLQLEKGLSFFPGSYLVRSTYMKSLLPRWGGSYPAMQAFADQAYLHRKKNPLLATFQGWILADSADFSYSNKSYVDAEKLYNQALNWGESCPLLYKRAKNYYRLEKYPQAESDLLKAIAICPGSDDYRYWLAKTYYRLKRFSEAFYQIETAAQFNPGNQSVKEYHQFLLQQTNITAKSQQDDKALELQINHYLALIEANPKVAENHYQKALRLIQLNKLNLAELDLKRAINLAPDQFEYARQLDLVLFKQGRLDEIIPIWNHYIVLKPKDSRAYMERAGTYYHLQDLEQAMRDAQKAHFLGQKDALAFYQRMEKLKAQSRQ